VSNAAAPADERTKVAFLDRLPIRDPGACWIWAGMQNVYGYGTMRIDGRKVGAHRIAWWLAHGEPAPKCMCVCHRCDVPLCCNPAHLFLGTRGDNNRDRNTKGRQARGERSSLAVLTEAQVRAIRARAGHAESDASIGRDFGVTDVTVGHIRRRRTWKHVA
jgi:hypothetical protein